MNGTTPPPDFKPHPARHAFSKAGISIFVVLIVGLFAGSAFISHSLIQSGQLASVINAVLVDLTNGDRTEEKLGTLTVNSTLVAAAQAKANDMAEKGYFAHTSPEGIDPWYWMNQAGYSFSLAGENLAVNFSDSEDVVQAWMNSPGHRANILNGKFTEIGVATAVGEYKGRKTTFVVQMFGTPRTTTASAPVVRSVETPENPEETAIAVTDGEDTEVLGTGVADISVDKVDTAPEQAPVEKVAPRYASDLEILLVSPHTLLRLLYGLCALVILVALAFATRLELRRHHTPHALAAFCLLLLIGGLFITADWFVFTHPVVADSLALLSL